MHSTPYESELRNVQMAAVARTPAHANVMKIWNLQFFSHYAESKVKDNMFVILPTSDIVLVILIHPISV